MKRELTIALRMTLASLVLTGVVYPLAVTGICRVFFHRLAAGSLVTVNGQVVGSELIGQNFKRPEYFHGRPSGAGADGYDASASSGSNLGPTSQKLRDRVLADVAALRTENPNAPGPIPVDLITASGSGLDPHATPDAILWQVSRVAAARGITDAELEQLVAQHVEPRTGQLLGEPRINVLLLNAELDRRWPRK